ncbi:unnamed protein product [Schistosoma curassoni]|uniref:Spindle assembly checkpoint component MAD1 n=1 Tax=Schistosoma curassoni TaxID=6186 RepID=A0A183KLD5_9TREM|nr:unnamed protein product [Schistosoma curassoni]
MDNEAKRSELFDLRSRFDAKSAQVDKMSAEFKTKERLCSELTTQLANTRGQLENTIKELESVRCRAVRGGAEVERWHSDLTSLQTTNKFLSSQLNDLRNKVIAKDKMIVELGKRCESILNSHPIQGITIYLFLFAILIKLESELANAQQSVQKLSEEVAREKETAYNSTSRVQELTAQVNKLETDLSQTRMQLIEAQSDHQKENDINASAASPPAKRTRRSTNAVNNVKANSKSNQAQFTPVKNLWKISAPVLGFYIRSTPRFILYHTKCTLMTTSNLNRSILKQIFLSFRAMFYRERPRLVGVDKSGNRYFEAPPNKASEHTHLSKLPKRFFLMPGQNGLECSHGNMDVGQFMN